MDVSIVIINYNTRDMTSQCIESIVNHTEGIEYEIILIDNNSTDGSKEFFKDDNRVRYIYSYENMGFGRANNVGMMLSRGNYILLLNSDTLLANNAIKEFYDFANSWDKDAFIGSWLIDDNGSYIHSGGHIHTISNMLFEILKTYIPGRHEGDRNIIYTTKKVLKVGYVTGADLFFHRSVYEKTKGFDHNYFMYFEESDWQRSAKKHDIESFLINGPKIIHLEGGSQLVNSSLNLAKLRRITKSRYYYFRKEYSFFLYAFFRIFYPLLYFPKIILNRQYNFMEKIRACLVIITG